ncbi:MAG TPA: hypothetical protein VJZ71_20310 [Phycisphaerae bacterium]|nr:hypothetical protein [Phycisphaerae bacterium]
MIANGDGKTYEVGVARQYVCRGTMTVRATSLEEARRLALDQIGDVALTMDELVEGGDRVEFVRAV